MKCELVQLDSTTEMKLTPENEDDQKLLQGMQDIKLADGRLIFYKVSMLGNLIEAASMHFWVNLKNS